MRTDLPIHYYNPELTLDWLIDNCPLQEWYTRLLEIDHSVVRCPDAETVIAASLFNRSLIDHTGQSKNENWNHKYYSSLLRNIEDLDKLGGDVCVDVFVDPELRSRVTNDIKSDRVNFHFMKHSSIGATGMFWRFLLSDIIGQRECSSTMVIDIDLKWTDHFDLLKSNYPCTPVFYSRGEDALVVCTTTRSEKYTSVCGGLHTYPLDVIGFSMREAIARYWFYVNNLLHLEPQNEFNRPMVHHQCGFGNTWNFYGNDERFLCKFLYYVLKRKRSLNLVMQRVGVENPLPAEKADMEFTKNQGCKVIGV